MGREDGETTAHAFKPPTIYSNWVGVDFSPDSKSLLFKHYGENFPDESLYKIRDIGATQDRMTIEAEPQFFAFSPDGSHLVTGATCGPKHRMMLWEWDKGKPILLTTIEEEPWLLAFSPDGSPRDVGTTSGGQPPGDALGSGARKARPPSRSPHQRARLRGCVLS